jgi:hypothetical protein
VTRPRHAIEHPAHDGQQQTLGMAWVAHGGWLFSERLL